MVSVVQRWLGFREKGMRALAEIHVRNRTLSVSTAKSGSAREQPKGRRKKLTMSHIWRNREERWSEALCLPTGLIDLSSAGDTPTRRSVTRDISRTARLRDKRRPYVPAKPVRCQTLVNTEDGEGEPCGRIATFIVKGRPGNLWWGFHCDPHALDVARHMGHQGGSVIVPIEDAR